MSRAVKSKVQLRAMILNALTYGVCGGRTYSQGAIFKLLQKLDKSLHYIPDTDYEGIQKIATTYLKLAQLAIPTAAQEDAIKAGINPVSNMSASYDALMGEMQRYIAGRRILIEQSIQPKAIETQATIVPDLKELARQELSKRHANDSGTIVAKVERITPTPGAGVEGG